MIASNPKTGIKTGYDHIDSAALRAGLAMYDGTLDRRMAAHLMRRTSFYTTAEKLNRLIGRDVDETVENLIYANRVAAKPPHPDFSAFPPPPRTAPSEVRQQYNMDNNSWVGRLRTDWVREFPMASLREKMTLFWSDHFATERPVYRYAFYGTHYLQLLRNNALENFKTLVYHIGLESAMLIYLNGNTNKVGTPNENYARELLELFTMGPMNASGEPNYSEFDVKELARALTGWIVHELTGYAFFDASRHDSGPITLFGTSSQTMGYDQVVEALFEHREEEIAWFIASKLYGMFVYVEPHPIVVGGLAQHLQQTNFSIFSTLAVLLKSEHFYDTAVEGTQIKAPADFVMQLVKMTGRTPTENEFDRLERLMRLLDQEVLNPPNVAGWPGHHDWISTNSLPTRWTYSDYLLFGGSGIPKADLVPVAAELVDPDDPLSAFLLPTALAEYFLAVPLASVDIPEVTGDFAGDIDQFPVPDEILSSPPHVRNLAKIFLGGTPWYEWHLNNLGANDRLLGFAQHLVRYPEFQLM